SIPIRISEAWAPSESSVSFRPRCLALEDCVRNYSAARQACPGLRWDTRPDTFRGPASPLAQDAGPSRRGLSTGARQEDLAPEAKPPGLLEFVWARHRRKTRRTGHLPIPLALPSSF